MTDAPDPGTVSDHPSEVLYRDARMAGAGMVIYLTLFEMLRDPDDLRRAVEAAIEAASLYHEAQREAGECPMCGSLNTDPWGGLHRNESLGCCIEPPERTFDEALGFQCDERERSAAAMRLKR